MLIDTHCHLNFAAFEGREEVVLEAAKVAGVGGIIVPGTDLATSLKAVELSGRSEWIYAAVGIHPHHIYQYQKSRVNDQKGEIDITNELAGIEKLLGNDKVVAVGEVGIDRHYYIKTKHEGYEVNADFVALQKEFFIEQIKLAHKHNKALIIHNREAKRDVLDILTNLQPLITDRRSVFHCCEPDDDLLAFAKEKGMFIGIDGDIAYRKDKQEFIRKVPLAMLVLETDSPYLSPLRKFPNEPANIMLIAETVADLKAISVKHVADTTTENARRLFGIQDG